MRCVQKVSRILCFFKSYLFIYEYLFVPFKVIPTRYYTLVAMFFPILEALQKIIFCVGPLQQIWVVADRVIAMLFLVEIEQFWYEFRGDPCHAQIIAKNRIARAKRYV